MGNTIFYSWQSDLPNKTNRTFIEEALERAIKGLSQGAEIEKAMRPSLDKDTQGVPGSPPIVETIFKKIEQCAVFVPDLTFVGKNEGGRLIPNPNVLIEYGYALKVCGHERIVPVMNSAYGEPSWETLPFDMRHLRHPITYHLAKDATTKETQTAREDLVKKLASALRDILAIPGVVAPADESSLFPATPSTTDPSTFMQSDECFTVPWGFRGEEMDLNLYSDNRLFLRLIPETSLEIGSSKRVLDAVKSGHLVSLGDNQVGFSDRNRHGAFTGKEKEGCLWNMTQLFPSGELWGIDACSIDEDTIIALREYSQGVFPVTLIERIFSGTLENYLIFLRETLGYTSRVKMIAGAANVQGYKLGTTRGIVGHLHDEHIVYESFLSSRAVAVDDALNPLLDYFWETCGEERFSD